MLVRHFLDWLMCKTLYSRKNYWKIITMLKPLAIALLSVSVLTACATKAPDNTPAVITKDSIIFTEPDLSAPFYAYNPFDYSAPPVFEANLLKASIQPVAKMIVANPSNPSQKITLDKNLLIIPTVNSKTRSMKYAVLATANELDVTEIDELLQTLEGQARHYPPRYTNRQERRGLERKLRQVSTQLDELAANNNASYDVLIRAFKASVLGRNLDLGAAYTTKSLTYAQRLLKIDRNDPETNFWFGFGLSEGGGQREAIQYLDKAMSGGVQEAYLVSVNNYLALEQKKNAIQMLNNYKIKFPQEAQVADRLIKEVQTQNRWNVWQVLAPK